MPSKYEAFSDIFKLERYEIKALLYLRYSANPEKMDYRKFRDSAYHDKERPVSAKDVARGTSSGTVDISRVLGRSFRIRMINRTDSKPGFRRGRPPYLYYLNRKQDSRIKKLERMSAEYYELPSREGHSPPKRRGPRRRGNM